jgi:hypothetical protein
MQGLCMCGELSADTKKGDCMGQPVNQNRTGKGLDLFMELRYPKTYGLFFGRRAVSAFLGSCDDSHKFTAAPVCPPPTRVMLIAAAISGLRGA